MEGQRIRLIKWGGTADPTHMNPGKTGTVAFVDDLGTVHIDWDNGGRLGLIPGVDRWEVMDDQNTTE